jgi:hypothetical protein
VKTILKLLFLVALLVNAARADEINTPPGTKIFWDCAFSAGQDLAHDKRVDCEDLASHFFTLNASIVTRVSKASAADLRIELGNMSKSPTEIRYTMVIHPSGGYDVDVMRLPSLDLSTSQDEKVSSGIIVARLHAGVSAFRATLGAHSDEAGNLIIEGADTGAPAETGKVDRLAKTPWYFEGGAQGSDSKEGSVKTTNLEGGIAANYRIEKYRIELDVNGTYIINSVPTGEETYRGQLFIPSVKLTGVLSTSKRWSFAIISDNMIGKGVNVGRMNQLEGGVEYIVVPFRTNERNQFVVRAGPSFTALDLVDENERGHLKERLYSAFTQIAYVNTFAKNQASFTVSGKALTHLNAPGYEEYSLKGQVAYQISQKVTLKTSVKYKFAKKSLVYPKNPDYSNPAQVAFVESLAPGVNHTYSFGVSFHLGNQKRSFDKRWSDDY